VEMYRMSGNDLEDYFSKLKSIQQVKFVEDFIAHEHGANALTLELMNANYLSKNKTGVLVFYSPTCKHCKDFAPTYANVAEKLKSQVFFGAVNCFDYIHKNDILSDFLKVEGVPAIKFVRGNKFIDYTGGKELKVLLANICKQYGICNFLPDTAEYREPGKLTKKEELMAEIKTGGKKKKKRPVKKVGGAKKKKTVSKKRPGAKKKKAKKTLKK
jgi:thiol-disulfide isomerase/thioredoxin